eukprot:CAMPEP_0196588952 /NCGR_PEP_ID=MMETSP1081-20130531/62186_1 /TAXON_ID=36882 /ORGANISM="Pyramimonas amylifera, Strain CCMP720" /LENGTH=68 /DNA_ID=CAMNT_0041911605 /DNA_START=420 /DNA_END=626 /DNA_ORIENTATION=+
MMATKTLVDHLEWFPVNSTQILVSIDCWDVFTGECTRVTNIAGQDAPHSAPQHRENSDAENYVKNNFL